MSDLFEDSLWPGLIVWIGLYISDYVCTIRCARMYRAGVKDKIVFEGSLEITPYFQGDVDRLRTVSPRFLLALSGSTIFLALLWWLTRQPPALPEAYAFALGAMILLQLAVHVRHVRNIFLFRAALDPQGVWGRIEYSRRVMLRGSSRELLAFAAMFFVTFLATNAWFTLGGAVACLLVAWKHQRLARKHVDNVVPAR